MSTAKTRLLLRNPVLYEAGIVAKMLRKSWQQRSDAFFGILARLPDEGMALDIGANRGQSALTIAALKPEWKIVSFEPNSSCAMGLGAVQMRVGANLTVLFEGLGETASVAPYFEPTLAGFPLTTEGTFNRDNLGERAEERMRASFGYSKDEFARDYAVREKFFRMSRLDDFGFSPRFIKIDTQGFELECVRGGRSTIDQHSPVIVCEANRLNNEALAAAMNELAYSPCTYEADGNRLVPFDPSAQGDKGTVGDFFWLRDVPEHSRLQQPET